MSTSNRPGVPRPPTLWPWGHLRITTTALGRRRLVLGLALLVVLASVIVVRRPNASPVLATVTLGQAAFVGEDVGVALDTRIGRAFIGSDDEGRVYVLDTVRGALLHTDTVVSSAHRLPICQVIVLDEQTGRAFVCNGGSVSMIDAASGRLLSAIPLPGATGHWLAVDTRSRHLFVLSNSMPLSAAAVSVLDAGSGRLLRRLVLRAPGAQSIQSISLPYGISPLAVDPRNARVFVGHFDSNRLSVLDARSGQFVRTVTVGQPDGSTITVHGPIVDERTHRVFVGDADSGTVTMLDAVSGQIVRTVRVGLSPAALVADTRTGRILLFTAKGVSVLDATSGRLLHTTRLGQAALANPVVDERTGTVFALDMARQGVDMFDGTRGRLLRTVVVGGNLSDLVVDPRSGHVLVLRAGPVFLQNGWDGRSHASLSVLDGRSGSVLRTVAVGVGNGRVVVDARGARAVVLLSGWPAGPGPTAWGWVPSWVRRALPFIPRGTARVPTVPASVAVLDTRRL